MTAHEIDLPWTSPPLSLNHRRHWRANAKLVAQVRKTAFVLVKNAHVPPAPRVRVALHYRPSSRRTRDEENYVPTLKAICDGIVDAGIVRDDAPEFMSKPMPVLHPVVSGAGARVWMVVEPLAAAQDGAA